MTKLGPTELEVIFLGIKKKGVFNEADLENSNLKKLGVGRILDILGELRERDLISIGEKEFSVTEKTKEYLWSQRIPLNIRILRLLLIKPYNLDEISEYLLSDSKDIEKQLESLRMQGFVLMSPVWKDSLLEKTFEILQEGADYLDKVESGKEVNIKANSQKGQTNELLSQIQIEIESIPEINSEKKRSILENIQKIRNMLD